MTGTEICAVLVWGSFFGFWLLAEVAVYTFMELRARRLEAGATTAPLQTAYASGRRPISDFLRTSRRR